jgi:3-oxoacyl-[acyl-carrier-protein] synthase-3
MDAADVYIDHFGHALGEHESSVEAAAARGLLVSDPAALRAAGFDRHHMAAPECSVLDLSRRAALPLASSLGDDIGALVHATCLPRHANAGSDEAFERTRDVKHLMDFPGSRLQSELGLRRAAVFGLGQQGCAALVGSIRVACALLQREPDLGRALCVVADRFPEGALYEQAYNLMSDGATACLASREPHGFRVLAAHALTNGAMACVSDDQAAGSFFAQAVRTIHETLARAGRTLDTVDFIVPQNVARPAWQVLARVLRFDFERVLFPTLGEVGHLVCGDNLINLQRAVDQGRVGRGQVVLLFTAGYGFNWAGLLLERQ